MKRLAGQIALVTGGSRGIGRCIALHLAKAGADVAISYKSSQAEAKKAVQSMQDQGVEAFAVQSDVADIAQARNLVQQVQDKWGRLDILVNNAGVTRDRTLRKMSDEEWTTVLDTNLGSVYAVCSQAWDVMLEQGRGRIVNIASFVGQCGNYGQSNYAASKGGLIAMTKTMALEGAQHDITVNAIAPGFIETDMVAGMPEEARNQLLARIPLGRLGEPADVARAVVFLAAEGDYITGQQINVNGGIYM